MPVVTPEWWYIAWWLVWTVLALAGFAGALHYVVTKPIVAAIERTRIETAQ